MDSISGTLSKRVVLLETQKAESYLSFTNLLNIEKSKNSVQAEILNHTESLVQSYKDENGVLRKQVKREKRKTKAVGVIGIVVIVLALL